MLRDDKPSEPDYGAVVSDTKLDVKIDVNHVYDCDVKMDVDPAYHATS